MDLTDLQPFTAERTWTVEDIPVLTARISLPEPVWSESRPLRRLQRYYRSQCRAYLRYCENWLLPQAEAEYRAALAVSTPLPCLQTELNYTVTYREGQLLSLYTQSREPTPTGLLLTRRGDTWDLSAGYPLPLQTFFPPRSNWKKQLLAQAAEEIRRRETAGTARWHANWQHCLRRHFNPLNYYLTPEGLTFFYPMHSIAPTSGGIPAFTVPFGQLHLPPEGA